MWNDPIVEEVRAARNAHAKKNNYDLKSIATDLKKQQTKGKRKVVTLSPKKVVVLPKSIIGKEN